MTYQSGSAISYYILDISDAERKAAQLRSLYQGIRQDAASLSTPIVTSSSQNTSAITAQITTRQTQATAIASVTSATQALINATYEEGIAAGLTNEKISAQLAALSQSALATGALTEANELQNAAYKVLDGLLPTIIEEEVALLDVRKTATKTVEQQANEELRLEQTRARELAASGNSTGALQLLTNARNNATNASEQAIASANVQIASYERVGTITGAIKGQLLGLVSPLALIALGFQAINDISQQVSAGIELNASLDEAARSAEILLRNTREGTTVYREANEFAEQYGFTQKEISDTVQNSIPIFKSSNESVEQILGTFARLQILKPGKTFQDATRAITELQSGNYVSLQRIFDIPAADAQRMAQEVKNGGDAIQILSKYLTDAGVGMDALANRTEGARGKARELTQETEKLSRAYGGEFGGVGLFLLNQKIQYAHDQTRLLSGDFTDLRQKITDANPSLKVFDDLGIAIGYVRDQYKEIDPPISAYGANVTRLKGDIHDLSIATDTNRHATLRAADADDRLAGGALNASIYVDKLTKAMYDQNQVALQDQRAGERSGGLFDTIDQVTSFYDKQHTAAAQAAQDAKDLQNAELNYARQTNDTQTQRKILNEQLVAAKGNAVEELNIKSQIAQLDKPKNTTSKGLSGLDRTDIKLAGDYQDQLNEVNRRLKETNLTQQQRNQLLLDQIDLQNKINDATQKERDLQISISLDSVHDQQKRIEESAELEGLRRAENDSRFSAAQQQAIRLREQEILLDQQKRSNDYTKEQAELQKTIKASGIGTPQDGLGAPQTPLGGANIPPIGSGLPVASGTGLPQGVLAQSGVVINLSVTVDKDNNIKAVQTDPAVALNLIAKSFATQLAAG